METMLALVALSVAIVAGVAFAEANRTVRPSLDGKWWGSQAGKGGPHAA